MTTGGFRVTALRVKLPCDDEKDFYARLADTIAEKGLRVPTANLRPVGTRVRVVLEFRDARTVSGEGIVDAHVEGSRPTMNVRLVKFERARPAGGNAPAPTPAPAAAATPPSAPAVRAAVTPVPGASRQAAPAPAAKPAVTPVPRPPERAAPAPAAKPAVTPVPAPAPPTPTPAPEPAEAFDPAEEVMWAEPDDVPATEVGGSQASAPTSAPETSFASLMDEAIEEGARPPDAPPKPPAAGTEQLEPLYDAAPEPEPTPPPQPAAAPARVAVPAASRRAAFAAVGAAAVLCVGILAYGVARRPAPPPADPAAIGAAAAADLEAQLVSRIAAADRGMSEGRLSGPDGALDHLLAARALKADDARVNERLRLLADTLEMLGGRAIERGDGSEAEVHLTAALRAAPDRQSISEKLRSVPKADALPGARSRPGAADRAP